MASDIEYMARAIELARKGRFTTSPNPCVGCVLVKDGEVVGEGYHQYAGGPHAEVNALRQAGSKAKGATCYVTLEPCSHYGRTPPCAEGLIEAGVAKVIAAMVDPNPQVSGRGLKKLEAAGIEVQQGLLQSDALALNRGFIKRMKGQGPFIQVKMASTLDGKTALSNGKSQWITGPAARADVQKYRAAACAVISGADTVLMDGASLNVRWQYPQAKALGEAPRQPVRVIIDTQNRLHPDLPLFSHSSSIIIIRSQLDEQPWPDFVEQVVVSQKDGKADLKAVVALLSNRGLNQLWVEAGATLAGAFVQQGLVDELIIYQAAKLIGSSGRSLLNLSEFTQMDQVLTLLFEDVRMVGDDLRITAKPIRQE